MWEPAAAPVLVSALAWKLADGRHHTRKSTRSTNSASKLPDAFSSRLSLYNRLAIKVFPARLSRKWFQSCFYFDHTLRKNTR
jgi:hypothetical protein